ncbi:MAG: hypothetical protein J1D89_07410 [Agathobacter sp.]|nr:hypothetical protein [Agathobacter sp.]
MSQAKVEQYKKDKANRKQIMRKEKLQRAAGKVCAWAILLAIIGWAGYSGVSYYLSKQPVQSIYADLSAMMNYIDGLDSEESAETDTETGNAEGTENAQ